MPQPHEFSPSVPPPEIITVREAMAILRVSDRFVYNAIESGDLPATKLVGRKAIRLRRADVEALMQPIGGAA